MLKKHKLFDRPKKPFDIVRIKSEDVLVERYGLKNKREIWKAKAKLDNIRRRAKKLINESSDVQDLFLAKLNKYGFKVGNVVEVLALGEEDVLKRRLQSVLLEKKLATTAKGARQLITHKHVSVDGVVVNIPSYRVSVEEENQIKVIEKAKTPKAKEPESVVETPSEEVVEAPVEESVETPVETAKEEEPKVEVAPAQ